ncbi:MAG: glycosyltransferase family 4 protein [Candidatus Krumholzibacteriota bacterium]|nr:glycosyltransferase family 4 protein [Candidatus Krumholzibacteriota bacterium]
MNIGALLPHMMVFGGVRRYIELGNIFVSRGHSFTIYTPSGEKPLWLGFEGKTGKIDDLAGSSQDILLTGSPEYIDAVKGAKAKASVFYLQIEGLKEEREIARDRTLHLMVNSSRLARRVRRSYSIEPIDGIGGVDPDFFCPGTDREISVDKGGEGPFCDRLRGEKLNILCYGRLSRPRKGTRFAVKAAADLYRKGHRVELHLFDSAVGGSVDGRIGFDPGVPFRFYSNISQESLREVYRGADIFVTAEKRAGWNNTAAEAAACSLAIVTTGSGTGDFAVDCESALVVPFRNSWFIGRAVKRLAEDPVLRKRLGEKARQKVAEFSWERLCDKMETGFYRLLDGNRPGK